jgi:serine protease AprX
VITRLYGRFNTVLVLLSLIAMGGFLFGKYPAFMGGRVSASGMQASKLSPSFLAQLPALADDAPVGTAIVTFNSSNGLQESHLNILRGVGVTGGLTYPRLGMVAQPMTAGQVRALAANPAVLSVWSNDNLKFEIHQARILGGVDKLQTTSEFHFRNGGMPVSGAGDFSALVIDSGIDATHADLALGTKVVQNVQAVTPAGNGNVILALNGFTPHLTIENVPNTDQTVGHGTHCAGILGGTGIRSGGLYKGVAPGAKIIGAGLGAGLYIINGLAAWEWGLANQSRYNIRIVSNSYSTSEAGFNPNNPLNRSSLLAYQSNMIVLFAAGNDGLRDTYNPLAQAPWVIGVAASNKEGDLATFSSRGVPRAERLSNDTELDDFNAPTITAPGDGRGFASNAGKFTYDMVSTRSSSNLVANGNANDAELPVNQIPFYTMIHGTSMATPFAAGVVALMLDADPTLSPDDVKEILKSTASRMTGREEWEVGAGHINAYAAVDKVFNRSRNYRNIQDVTFNSVFGEERPAVQPIDIDFDPTVSGAGSANSRNFTVEPGMDVLDIFARVDTIAEEGTGNFVGIRVWSPSGATYGGGSIPTPVIGTDARQVIVLNPEPGTWRLEVRGASGLTAVPGVTSPTQIAAPGPVEGTITQVRYVLPLIADIQGHSNQAAIEQALRGRLMDTYADGTFRPDATLTREDLARLLALNTSLRQTVNAAPRFSDTTGDLGFIAESVTAKGSSLRDFDFVPTGMMTASATTFNPMGTASRLDVAVAMIKALGHDAAARALAGSTVTYQGTALTDNAQIPSSLRGYVQLAIDKGLFEAFPAEVRQVAPGQFIVVPGPRFEPGTSVTRATLAGKLNRYRALFTTGG